MYTRGTARLVNGEARITLPDHFQKLASADGNVLWAKRIAAGTIGNIQGVGVDASGAIVAAGRIGGAFDFGGQHFDTAGNPSSALMFVFEPDGKERVARVLPDTNEVLLAVDPPGRASLAGAGSATAEWVVMYDLAGAPLNSSKGATVRLLVN